MSDIWSLSTPSARCSGTTHSGGPQPSHSAEPEAAPPPLLRCSSPAFCSVNATLLLLRKHEGVQILPPIDDVMALRSARNSCFGKSTCSCVRVGRQYQTRLEKCSTGNVRHCTETQVRCLIMASLWPREKGFATPG